MENIATVERNKINSAIKMVRNGNQTAFSELVEQYNPLIESLVSSFCSDDIAGMNRDDLRQEAIFRFYNSIMTYDTEQSEIEFGLYAKICISNALVSQLRLHKKHTSEHLTASINTMFFVHDSEDPTDKVLEEESVRALHSVIKKNLSAFEYRVWNLYVSGMSAKQIGKLVDKDEKSVANAIYRIRKKLRAQLG